MRLIYEGDRVESNWWNGRHHRTGTFEYEETEDDAKVMAVFDELISEGWKIDTGVQGWGGCEVFDRDEFNELMADFKAAKKHHHLR